MAGGQEFIRRARRARKVVGGAQRQVGIVAAAGIVAITEMVERLADDHANAKQLAHGLAQIEGIAIDAATVETNLVFFKLTDTALTPPQLSVALAERGVLLLPSGGRLLRAVTNYHVSAADIDYTLAAIRDVLASGATGNGRANLMYN